MRSIPRWRDREALLAAAAAIVLVTLVLRGWLHATSPVIAALAYLLIVLLTATVSRLRAAVVICVAADLCLNYFFMPPLDTLTIADPQNWAAFLAFVAVSVVAGSLSSAARRQAFDATARRDELARLFDLSRDVLLTTDSRQAVAQLAGFVARRFELALAAICLPAGGEWSIHSAGSLELALDAAELSAIFERVAHTPEFDARARAYTGHETIAVHGRAVHVVPLRFGTKVVGLLAAAGGTSDPGTLDALAGIVAIAMERAELLDARTAADMARQSEALKSALLASLGHDLRTPLTAIRVAAANLQASWVTEQDRREQSDVILVEVARLQRLFQNILEMARIDAGAVSAEHRWVHPQEIVEAARDHVEPTLRNHPLDVQCQTDEAVRLDPRLTAAALAQVLENAARYSPAEAPIAVSAALTAEGLVLTVRDHGAGLDPRDLPHLFERFYRGADATRVAGTGMGLAIARGLLAVESGRIRAENCPDGGAQFTITVPAEHKAAPAEASS